ncbi:alpha/beta fold hydrolase [Catalinimonas niigatensis]|uniref:alpha/beta fold hydrolase n=1 Tax=Catalinimonas niigatensis TaxID=1397264 RepID=UPI0026659446|nr:alpha/beta hydrolase [Catalinimonas niigatensis]WPP48875.1 alpha/beta hydrolase [Catalinimonas niigatensis]
MPFITNKNAKELVDIYFEDYGNGQPVILIHGWPLSHKAWEGQVSAIVDAGFRCISYDRRGFGSSSAPWESYDYSALASDLHELITQLELDDCILCGFSMGGGEVVRYFTDYGADKIAKAALISSIIPLVKQKPDNPDGVPEEALKEIMQALRSNRVGFLEGFHKNFYNYDDNKDRMSAQHLHYDWSIAAHASPRATIKCAEAWGETDFRSELKNVAVPTLIVHGDADQIVPIDTAGKQAAEGIPNNQYEVIKGGPHGLNLTHRDQLNEILLAFLKK